MRLGITVSTTTRLSVALILLLLGILSLPANAAAHEPHGCPEGIADVPAIENHLDQAAIMDGSMSLQEVFDAGALLFDARFNTCDGQGRPATTGTGEGRLPDEPAFTRVSSPESNSCAGCHNQPRSGGGGDFVANVFVLAQGLDPVTESISSEFSNNRNTLGMFGSGPIEMLAREMTADLHTIRDNAIRRAVSEEQPVTLSLNTKGVNFGTVTANPDGTLDTDGVRGVHPDLVVRPFHQVGVVVSLREFTVNAMNHHHGMQAEERFDLIPEVGEDFDQDGFAHELTLGDITAVTVYQAALGAPGRLLPDDPAELERVAQGEALFSEIGCATCHVPELHLDNRFFTEPNPYNPDGTLADTSQTFAFDMTREGEGPFIERDGGGALVAAYTDLKRHNLCDDPARPDAIRHFCNEELAQTRLGQDDRPGTEFFLTRKLWDVGNSGPYGHVGDLTTIAEAILMHGGEARESRDRFAALNQSDQSDVVAFLYTLQILPPGSERIITDEPIVEAAPPPAAPMPTVQPTPLPAAQPAPASPSLAPFYAAGVLVSILLLGAGLALGRQLAPRPEPEPKPRKRKTAAKK